MALQTLVDYQPINAACGIAQLLQLQATLAQAEQAEVMIETSLAQARRVRIETSHAYHDLVVSARTQVLAQYGPDAYDV
jgi:dTDP-4-amino-4,6-dideoxygalactose transaminase